MIALLWQVLCQKAGSWEPFVCTGFCLHGCNFSSAHRSLSLFIGLPMSCLFLHHFFHRLGDVLSLKSIWVEQDPRYQAQPNSCSAAATAAFVSAMRRALVWAQPEERSPEESKGNRSNFRSKGCRKTKDQGSAETKGKQDLIRSRHPALHCELWPSHWKEGSGRQTWQSDLNSQMQISFVLTKNFLIFVLENGKRSKLIWRAAWGQSIASLPGQDCLGAGEDTFSLRGVAFLLLMVALDDAPYCQLGGKASWNEAAAGALDARCIITSH